MPERFDQEKATATAAYLLKLRGGRMSYLKLIKLLYLADREAFGRWGFGITTDRYVSMPHGPVVSNIYNLITEEERETPFWSRYISAPSNYEVRLIDEDIPDLLSRAEQKLLSEIFASFGTWGRWKLVEHTHTLPEWRNPNGSSIPIRVEDILQAQGASQREAVELKKELESLNRAKTILNGRV
jgi:uncharacterized phage-associated protein